MHQILKIFNLIKYTSEGESMEQQILLGLFIGILCLIFMIMKTKIHTFGFDYCYYFSGTDWWGRIFKNY